MSFQLSIRSLFFSCVFLKRLSGVAVWHWTFVFVDSQDHYHSMDYVFPNHYLISILKEQKSGIAVDGWNPAPVEVGRLTHKFQGFNHLRWLAGFQPSTVLEHAPSPISAKTHQGLLFQSDHEWIPSKKNRWQFFRPPGLVNRWFSVTSYIPSDSIRDLFIP